MHFKNYEYFLAIVQEGGVSNAAKKLYLSQPSLSKYIKRLETNLGVELFDHGSYPLKLTYTGEVYYNHLMQYIKIDKQFKQKLLEIKNEKSGEIQLGLAIWRGACLLPEVLPSFMKQYPGIDVSITEGRSSQLVSDLLSETLDFAVMNLPRNMNLNKFTYETLMHEEILLVGNKNNPIVKEALEADRVSRFPHIDIKRLMAERFILTKPGQNLTSAVDNYFSKHHLQPTNTFKVENVTTATNLVSAGLGFTFVPENGLKDDLIPKHLAIFSLNDPDLVWPLAVVTKKDAYTTEVARLFINHLKHYYAPVTI